MVLDERLRTDGVDGGHVARAAPIVAHQASCVSAFALSLEKQCHSSTSPPFLSFLLVLASPF